MTADDAGPLQTVLLYLLKGSRSSGSELLIGVEDALVERQQATCTGVAKGLQTEQILNAQEQRKVVVLADGVDAAWLHILGDQEQPHLAATGRGLR